MKLKNGIQRVIEIITGIAIILIMTTLESDITKSYLIFFGINLLIIINNVLILKKYGKYE